MAECLRLSSMRIFAKLLNELCLEFWLTVMEFNVYALCQLFVEKKLHSFAMHGSCLVMYPLLDKC